MKKHMLLIGIIAVGVAMCGCAYLFFSQPVACPENIVILCCACIAAFLVKLSQRLEYETA